MDQGGLRGRKPTIVRTTRGGSRSGRRFLVGVAVAFAVLAVTVASAQGENPPSFVNRWRVPDSATPTPTAMEIDADGHVLVLENDEHLVHEFASDGTLLDTWSTDTGSGDGPVDPQAMAIGADGSVYVADRLGCQVHRYDADGDHLGRWGDCGAAPGEFERPSSIATGPDGSVYVADTDLHRLQHFDADGDLLGSWSTRWPGSSPTSTPRGMEVRDGVLYLIDESPGAVVRYSSTGAFLGAWPIDTTGDLEDSAPGDVTSDALGNLYVTDPANARVLQISSTTGTRVSAWDHDDTVRNRAFRDLRAVAAEDDGTVYVLDAGRLLYDDPAYVRRFARVPRPDLRARLSTLQGWADDGVYRRPDGPVVSGGLADIASGQSATFLLSIQNDSPIPDAVRVKVREARLLHTGRPGPASLFRTAYSVNGADQGAALLAGTYVTPVLPPGGTQLVRIRVTARNPMEYRSRLQLQVTGRSTADATRLDTIWLNVQ